MRMATLIVSFACIVAIGFGVPRVTAAPLTAAPAKTASITVAIPDLNCTALGDSTFAAKSWSWGAMLVDNDRGRLEGLSLTRVSDGCSPALFKSLMQGVHNRELRLSQYDTDGVLKSTLWITDVMVTNWQIAGSGETGDAAEQVTLNGTRFTFTDIPSGARVCFDVSKYVSC